MSSGALNGLDYRVLDTWTGIEDGRCEGKPGILFIQSNSDLALAHMVFISRQPVQPSLLKDALDLGG